jgi:membrane-associated protease RseP (regulator of RpoE activity)
MGAAAGRRAHRGSLMILGILLFALGVMVMILAHEAGHFVAARAFGIKVDEFFIGFGPRLVSIRRGQTEYGIKAIPAGGYVRIAGMNPFQEPAPEDRSRVFWAKPRWQRAVVLVAGSATHFVLALVLLCSLFWFVGIPRFGERPEIAAVEERLDGVQSPAATAGLQPGDVIVEVDGIPITDDQQFSEYIGEHVEEEVRVTVLRDGRRVTVTATPVYDTVEGERRGRLGIFTQREFLGRDRLGPLQGLTRGGEELGTMVVRSFQAMAQVFGPEGISRIGQLLTGEVDRGVNDPVGVVGAARFSGQAVQAGFLDVFLALFAFFNVFVGILNILPLPPLDGGHLAVLGWEAVTGRRVDPRRLIPVTALVAGFLILFTVSLLYLDVVSPIPNPFG